VDKLRVAVSELSSERIISEKERQALHKQVFAVEEFAKDLQFKQDQTQYMAHDLQRESDIIKDRISTYSEKNSQLEKSKDKYDKISRDLSRQLEFAVQRRAVVSEETTEIEFQNKKLKRQVLEESYDCRAAVEDLNRLEEKLQAARNELSLKHAQYTQDERDREALGQDLYSTITHLEQFQTHDLAEPEKLRLEKQIFGFKNSITEEKARIQLIRKKTAEIDDQMESVRFDIKTLKQDIQRTRMVTNRTKKANDGIRALTDKKVGDSDDEAQAEADLLLSSDEEERNKNRRQRHKPTKPKRTERRMV